MGLFIIPENVMQILETKHDLTNKVKIYDHFVERQMQSTESPETRRFLLPIWKLRSSFNDALRPVEENMVKSLVNRNKMVLAAAAIREGRIDDQNVAYMVDETRKCYITYQEYMRRLKQLYSRTKYIFKTISHHKVNVLDEYAEIHHFDPIAIRHHYNRIVYVLEMAIVIGESIQDAMRNAQSVLRIARENLDTVVSCCKSIALLERIEDAAKTRLPHRPRIADQKSGRSPSMSSEPADVAVAATNHCLPTNLKVCFRNPNKGDSSRKLRSKSVSRIPSSATSSNYLALAQRIAAAAAKRPHPDSSQVPLISLQSQFPPQFRLSASALYVNSPRAESSSGSTQLCPTVLPRPEANQASYIPSRASQCCQLYTAHCSSATRPRVRVNEPKFVNRSKQRPTTLPLVVLETYPDVDNPKFLIDQS